MRLDEFCPSLVSFLLLSCSLEELLRCPSISILDLSGNSVCDPAALIVLSQMEGLKVLTLMGNPIVGKTRDYR